jgi:hypothetical protein
MYYLVTISARDHGRKDNRPICDGPIYIIKVDDGGGRPGNQNGGSGILIVDMRHSLKRSSHSA